MFVFDGDGDEYSDISEYSSYSSESLIEKMQDFGDISYSEVYSKMYSLYHDSHITIEQFNVLMFKGRDFLQCFRRRGIG